LGIAGDGDAVGKHVRAKGKTFQGFVVGQGVGGNGKAGQQYRVVKIMNDIEIVAGKKKKADYANKGCFFHVFSFYGV
jgi:hypothetical protein